MNNEELIKNGMEIMQSFDKAVIDAGGDFTKLNLNEMTAWDLISMLSTNNIRFVYGGKNDKN